MRLNQITLPSTDVVRGRDFYLRLGFLTLDRGMGIRNYDALAG